ncbi:MAG TPA: DUF4124 domain-containing protein [Burkholderiales bacterium]|nr:DUF4124 domain-containing protein [Burkholderiales bacterium]
MTPETRVLLLILCFAAAPVSAQVYRWVDEKGTVHYSNTTPPKGAKATLIDPDAKVGPPSPESAECYTVRCQGERLEQRLARREELEARLAAERFAAMPKPPRGLDFRKYVSLQRGMVEGELVTIAGSPDLLFWDPRSLKTYTYLPTPGDPFTTTITLIRGRISEIDRVRKF